MLLTRPSPSSISAAFYGCWGPASGMKPAPCEDPTLVLHLPSQPVEINPCLKQIVLPYWVRQGFGKYGADLSFSASSLTGDID